MLHVTLPGADAIALVPWSAHTIRHALSRGPAILGFSAVFHLELIS